MAENHSIFIAVRPIAHKGQDLLGDSWSGFCHALRDLLQQKGLENQDSADELLLFSYTHPRVALRSILGSLEQVKHDFNWQEPMGAVPVQIITHFGNQNDGAQSLKETVLNLQNHLTPEALYVTEPLMLQWEHFMEGNFPAHSFENEGIGVYRLEFLDNSVFVAEELFPYRKLFRQGSEKECFYCGMKNHKAANCPSKFLTMETQGLSEAGYLPVPRLSEIAKNAFHNQEKILNILAAGVTASQIRKDHILQVFIAYFDLFKIYQPRFLWNISFANFAKWEELGKPEVLTVDSQSMHFGLDCLRVGQYTQAEEFFVDESRRPKGKPFFATIGRAFMALEMERYSDTGHFLESAASMANSEKERIYISFLRSRHYEIEEDSWKAEQAVDNIFSVKRDCQEAQYRQIQLAIQKGYNEKALRQLHSLVMESRDFFMTALMDPTLLPISGPVEDMLNSRIQAQRQEAEEELIQARMQIKELQSWLAEDDPQMQAHNADIANIEKQYERQGYFDTLDIARQSKRLTSSCYHIQETKLDELSKNIENAVRRWEGYRNFWKTYTYQTIFKDFHATLAEIKNRLSEARPLAEKNKGGRVYRTAVSLLEEASEKLDKLKPVIVRMNGVKIILDGVKLFFRKLVITEIVLLSALVLLIPLLSFVLSGAAAESFANLLRQGWFQKQVLVLTTLLVGPMVALAQTLWKLMET